MGGGNNVTRGGSLRLGGDARSFVAKHSDLNILCILEQAGARELEQLHSGGGVVGAQGNSVAGGFHHGRAAAGRGYFRHRDAGYEAPASHALRAAISCRTSRCPWNFTGSGGARTAHESGCVAAVGTGGAGEAEGARRHHAGVGVRVLRAVPPRCDCPGPSIPATKREAVNAIAALTGANPAPFLSVLDLREGKLKEKDLAVDSTLEMYLSLSKW